MHRIGLIGAMSREVAPILSALADGIVEQVGTFTFHKGKLFDIPVVIGCCGIGKVNAAMGVQTMLLRYRPSLMVHMGVGGALSCHLKVGDVVIASDCVQYDVDTTALGDPLGMISGVEQVSFPGDVRATLCAFEAAKLHRAAGHRVEIGRVATGDRFVTHAEDKVFIQKHFGALSCDQESCAVAQACAVNNTPFAVIRAISDASDGEHGDEFRQNVGRVSDIAAGIALRFVEKYGNEFI